MKFMGPLKSMPANIMKKSNQTSNIIQKNEFEKIRKSQEPTVIKKTSYRYKSSSPVNGENSSKVSETQL